MEAPHRSNDRAHTINSGGKVGATRLIRALSGRRRFHGIRPGSRRKEETRVPMAIFVDFSIGANGDSGAALLSAG